MRSNHQILTVSCLSLALGLLVGTEGLGALDRPVEASVTLADSGPLAACTSHQVIGVLSSRDGDCSLPGAPTTPNWARHRMFDDSTPDLAAWTEAVPGELQRYCSYEYIGSGPLDSEAYDELLTAIAAYPQMSLESVSADCRREVVVQGDPRDTNTVASRLARQHHDAIQWVSGSILGATSSSRQFAALAILDSVSSEAQVDGGVEPRNDHGLVMRDIAADVACPGGEQECSSAIHLHLALPRSSDGIDWQRGGEFGTMGDLATSIVAAVGRWRMDQMRDPSAPKRLVISASLGWDADGPAAEDLDRGPVRALEQALNFAACNGAIVIAAAGNVSDPACSAGEAGPLAPARYELIEAPNAAECAQLGYSVIESAGLPIFGEARPLVYAAGGVDGRGRPIVNARPEAMPPLAAHAKLVSVETPDGFTNPMTGTSASTAVIAGIASLVWSYAPQLTADEVMRLIYESGSATALEADFAFSSHGSIVRAASACAALERACASLPAGHCPTLACAEAPFERAPELANVWEDQTGMCPARPWSEQLTPQPETPPCPMCMIDDDELHLILDDDYDNLTLENVTIELYDAQQGAEFIDYGDLPLTSSSTYVVTDSDLLTVDRSGLAPATAWVEMEFTDYSNPTGPVTVYAGNEIDVL